MDKTQEIKARAGVEQPKEDLSWADRFTVGEIVPLKGHWFRVASIHIGANENRGIALFALKPTQKAAKKAAVAAARVVRGLRVIKGGKK